MLAGELPFDDRDRKRVLDSILNVKAVKGIKFRNLQK